jgi:sterol desaturase/sphingolipid hydroxylase (fatty acid hydroxylase superfamily)
MNEIDHLPSVDSPIFLVLVALAILGPYVFIGGIYLYHFHGRKIMPKLRKADDKPLNEHIYDWATALFRPEGITAVVGYMTVGLALSLLFPDTLGFIVPSSIKTLNWNFNVLTLGLYFIVFDSTMWCIHYVQHRWRWLYYNTHSIHHTIKSPTIISALTGYLPDTCLLILVPLHTTLMVVPGGNFLTVFAFAISSLFHLHCIHSEFQHSWDVLFRKIGIVNSWDHHVHHLKPRKNLAHFFVLLDKVMGTYQDPMEMANIVITK